jgi:hypothetical protein
MTMTQEKTVIILGAGASASAGAPLMANFLDRARDIQQEQEGDTRAAFDDVFDAFHELRGVFAKGHLDIYNIESFFNAVEMARLLGKLGARTIEEIARLHRSTTTVIAETVRQSVRFPMGGRDIHVPGAYRELSDELERGENARFALHQRACFITFNYDTGLDYALQRSGITIDYGLREPNGGVPLLKLHGSLNWAMCEACGVASEFDPKFPNRVSSANTLMLSVERSQVDCPKCHTRLTQPAIVPPSASKLMEQTRIANVWRRAAQELRQASRVAVVGYSLPGTDSFFPHLWTLGSEGETYLREFTVYDICPERVKPRFEGLIGSSLASRFAVKELSFEAIARPLAGAACNSEPLP